ncbi:MAG: tRNA (adenosine(37)-N6)-dimethylallyltransferase MiaA [Acidobacteriota bacterium]|nr:tRNA (adenosine(37)-N6)-dimethylallyltransferase MiaA [Acidobacteriota bacterium]
MSTDQSNLPLLVVVGPTASGKSALAIALAKQLQGEILACDSTQLYRGFDIGTAKPSEKERQGIAHHLIDVLDPAQEATAGGYRDLALGVLADLRPRQRLPILTVGTGLYLRALLEGLADLPLRSEEVRTRLRTSARKHGPAHLHGVLRRMDAEAAAKIAPTDEQKVIRAVEVCLLTRKPISEVHRGGRTPLQGWRAVKIGLMPSRDLLHERIHARTQGMLDRGWMAEVERLVSSGLADDAKPFQFIGYRELLAVLRSDSTMEKARAAIEQATRHYAKRQLTWFRKDQAIRWFAGVGDDEKVQNQVIPWVQAQVGIESRAGK